MAATDAVATTKASLATPQLLIGANALRRADASGPSLAIANSSTAILYVLLGPGVPSATNFSYAIQPTGTTPATVEIWGYRGQVQCIWGAANGNATVTEYL